jgi:hypothetical protein
MSSHEEDDLSPAEFKALQNDAHALGIHYTGDDPSELHVFVQMARAERGKSHPVPCYGLSYDPTDRRCRICQLRNPCADTDKRPRVELVKLPLQALPCDSCGVGVLQEELRDRDTNEVRDYGCTTKGCQNTVSIQCGWESVKPAAAEIVLGEPAPEPVKKPEPVKPPALQVIQGGQGVLQAAESTTKKIKLKKVKPAVAPAAAPPPPAPPQPVAPPAAAKRGKAKPEAAKPEPAKRKTMPKGLRFAYDGAIYDKLGKVVNAATGKATWSATHFFDKFDLSNLKPGDVLERDYGGKTHKVEVLNG